MIEQYLIGAAAGGVFFALLTWRWQRRVRMQALTAMRDELDAAAAALRDAELHYAEQLEMCQTAREEVESENLRMEEILKQQSQTIDQLREEMEDAVGRRAHWVVETKKIADEATRLKGLAATFERWHEQMTVLMARNEDMHEKNQELAAIVKHVVIVAMNASIEAAKAAAAGRGFAVVANEVRSLALRTEGLSKIYSDCLHKNDLMTTAAFQDIQAGGKMIMASLSRVEAFSNQLQDQLEEAAA